MFVTEINFNLRREICVQCNCKAVRNLLEISQHNFDLLITFTLNIKP